MIIQFGRRKIDELPQTTGFCNQLHREHLEHQSSFKPDPATVNCYELVNIIYPYCSDDTH